MNLVSTKRHLGSLCERGHEYLTTGQSLRYVNGNGCLMCLHGKIPSELIPRFSTCGQCGKRFRYSPSQKRIYCSYQCHLNSGGALRAGLAAAKAKMKYGQKKDANHKLIFAVIEAHTAVKDLSSVGCGVPDGIAWIKNGWHLFDVKNPKTGYGKRGLNKRQQHWAKDWRGGPVYLIYTVEEADAFAMGRFDGLKCFDPNNLRIANSVAEALHLVGATNQ